MRKQSKKQSGQSQNQRRADRRRAGHLRNQLAKSRWALVAKSWTTNIPSWSPRVSSCKLVVIVIRCCICGIWKIGEKDFASPSWSVTAKRSVKCNIVSSRNNTPAFMLWLISIYIKSVTLMTMGLWHWIRMVCWVVSIPKISKNALSENLVQLGLIPASSYTVAVNLSHWMQSSNVPSLRKTKHFMRIAFCVRETKFCDLRICKLPS